MQHLDVIARATEYWPRCSRCKLPVELFEVIHQNGYIVLLVSCHDETEDVAVPDELWRDVTGPITFNDAFAG